MEARLKVNLEYLPSITQLTHLFVHILDYPRDISVESFPIRVDIVVNILQHNKNYLKQFLQTRGDKVISDFDNIHQNIDNCFFVLIIILEGYFDIGVQTEAISVPVGEVDEDSREEGFADWLVPLLEWVRLGLIYYA